METSNDQKYIRILVADDDATILRCYERAFSRASEKSADQMLAELSNELFGQDNDAPPPAFQVVACSQGEDAVNQVAASSQAQTPFDAVILDIRMPPGISGVEAGKRIREYDPKVPIVFVSGFSDVSKEELRQQVPPASRLHYYSKPLSFSDLAQQVADIVLSGR